MKKRVMVLGGAGFVGSSLVRSLLSQNFDVFVFDNLSTGHLTNLKEIEHHITFVHGDVLEKNQLKDSLATHGIEYIYHLVADPFVPNSTTRPEQVFHLITQSTRNVIECCHSLNIKKLIFFSTAEIYGNYNYLPMDELHPTNPISVYAAAKLASDNMCLIEHKTKGLPVVIVRLFNTYGPRETHPYIIPELISQLSVSNEINLGNLFPRRAFLFVEDVAAAMVHLLQKELKDVVYNLGSNTSYSVEELARMIGKLLGHDTIKISQEEHRIRQLDPQALECDPSKLYSELQWRPQISMEEGLKKTIEWYNSHEKTWPWEQTHIPASKNL